MMVGGGCLRSMGFDDFLWENVESAVRQRH
jgi:hypothetical protein